MGAGVHPEALRSRLRRLRKKHPGASWRVLRASNGEVCIVRDDPAPNCGACAVEDGARRPVKDCQKHNPEACET